MQEIVKNNLRLGLVSPGYMLTLVRLDMFLTKFISFKRSPPTAVEIGAINEKRAARFLKKKGYRIILKNWRHGKGEIDLVCVHHGVLVFVEVRARQETALVSGYHSISQEKQDLLKQTCNAYMRGMRSPPRHFRFDVVEVMLGKEKGFHVNLFENVSLFT